MMSSRVVDDIMIWTLYPAPAVLGAASYAMETVRAIASLIDQEHFAHRTTERAAGLEKRSASSDTLPLWYLSRVSLIEMIW